MTRTLRYKTMNINQDGTIANLQSGHASIDLGLDQLGLPLVDLVRQRVVLLLQELNLLLVGAEAPAGSGS